MQACVKFHVEKFFLNTGFGDWPLKTIPVANSLPWASAGVGLQLSCSWMQICSILQLSFNLGLICTASTGGTGLSWVSWSPSRALAGRAAGAWATVRTLPCQRPGGLKPVPAHSTSTAVPPECVRASTALGPNCPGSAASTLLVRPLLREWNPILLRPLGLDGDRTSQVSLAGPCACAPFLCLGWLLEGITVNHFIFLFCGGERS